MIKRVMVTTLNVIIFEGTKVIILETIIKDKSHKEVKKNLFVIICTMSNEYIYIYNGSKEMQFRTDLQGGSARLPP